MSLREGLVALLVAAAAGEAGAADPLTLAVATEWALARNGEVRAAEAEVGAARARLEGASFFLASNPELSVGVGPREAEGRRTVDREVALSQRIELGGQRGARVAAARAAVGAAEARLSATRVRVSAAVRELLGRASAARLRSEVAGDALRFAEQAATAAERRFQAGDVARIDVNSTRVERGRAARAAEEAEQDRLAAAAELELLMGAEPGTVSEVTADHVVPDFEAWGRGFSGSVEELVREALARRGDIAAARLDVAAAEAEASLANRSAVPTPTLGVTVGREEKASIVLGTLSVELPLFARNQGERGVTAARVQQAQVALAALERRAAQEVRLAAGRLGAARRVLAAFDAAATAALADDLALAARAYEAGQIDSLRYQLVRRDAVDGRRDRIDALEALNRAVAQLERALGRQLP
ncbi:MAG: TolC family protein [Deltaproteobacteria bacterium]|nr:TolC family protein [Deltaproteobacteria bacterium]